MLKILVILVQISSPSRPTFGAVWKYLYLFLREKRVVDLTGWKRICWPWILNLIIIPWRVRKVVQKYRLIWGNWKDDRSLSPMMERTILLADRLQNYFTTTALLPIKNSNYENIEVEVFPFFLFDNSSQSQLLIKLNLLSKIHVDNKEDVKIIIAPQFPQYSESTTALAVDAINKVLSKLVVIPNYQYISAFYHWDAFIRSCVNWIDTHLQIWMSKTIKISDWALILSFHGMPLRRIADKGDLYYQQCLHTYQMLSIEIVKKYPRLNIYYAFQSRFSFGKWLFPYTEELCLQLINAGKKNLVIFCPGFSVDGLETLYEIDIELRAVIESKGAELHYIPALNAENFWVRSYADHLLINYF